MDFKKDKDSRLAVVVGSGPSLQGFDRSEFNRRWIFPIVINDEYERAKGVFKPGVWIFNDPQFLQRKVEDGYEPYDDTPIVMSEMVLHFFSKMELKLPEWANRAGVYRNGSQVWNPQSGIFLMRRTTATAALCLAHWMGFEMVALFGVDCSFREDGTYYHDGAKKKQKGRGRSVLSAGNGLLVTDKHLEMISDFTKWKNHLVGKERDMRVIQTFVQSPLSCFEKAPWQNVVRYYGM